MFNEIIERIGSVFEELPDHRKASNGTKYSVRDAALSAFSIFFMQAPSFLAHQRDMKRGLGQSNVESLFGAHKTPCDNQIRKILDPIKPKAVGEIFWDIHQSLSENGALERFRSVNDTFLCGLDGTQYFSSYEISCEHCNQKEKDDKTLYSHTVIAPVLVAPGTAEVIALEPEFIWPQDGNAKQDCEQNAIKRWISRHAVRFAPYTLTILADDLHSRQPTCELCLEHKLNFILVCKPSSHTTLYEEISLLDRTDAVAAVTQRIWTGRHHEVHTYRYVNSVPLRTGDDALRVNWCEITTVHEATGEVLYKCAFITNFVLSENNVIDIIAAGRARWKTENESHNTLKNQGYHLAHNFGHGDQYLSMLLLSLNLLAFLTHTILDLTDLVYQQVRQELGARQAFFNDIRALTRYDYFESWSHLLNHMFTRLGLELRAPPL